MSEGEIQKRLNELVISGMLSNLTRDFIKENILDEAKAEFPLTLKELNELMKEKEVYKFTRVYDVMDWLKKWFGDQI